MNDATYTVPRLAAVAGIAIGLVLASAPLKAAWANPVSPNAYCTATGGTVETRIPTFGTNTSNPLALAYPQKFCNYSSKDGTTHFRVLLSTLVTAKPTLAALAYYAQVPFNSASCKGGTGPGNCYCAQLGGTDSFGGTTLQGGGWVLSTDSNDELNVCTFPDLSAMDAYGLFYHSAGIVRGQKLDHLLRYRNPY